MPAKCRRSRIIEKLPEIRASDSICSQAADGAQGPLRFPGAPYREHVLRPRRILLQDGNRQPTRSCESSHWLGYFAYLEEVIKGVGGDIALLDGVAGAIDTAAVALAETAGATAR